MPVTVSYPGVYVQEIPSGSQTIGGVATSITAFVGRTYRGPVNLATPIYSFADFQRKFGGLSNGYPLGYAVRDFYQNGGAQALIVRVYGPEWLTFPPSAEQTTNATAASKAWFGLLTAGQYTAADVAGAAASAAGQYNTGEVPESLAAATNQSDLAAAWVSDVGAASLDSLTATLAATIGQINAGAAAVVSAMAAAPTADDTEALLQVAQGAVSAQFPGGGQDGAQIVLGAVQTAYEASGATVATMNTAATGAQTAITTATGALTTAATAAAAATGADAETLLNALVGVTAAAGVPAQTTVAAINPLIAQVMPTPRYALAPTATFPLADSATLAVQMLSDNEPLAVEAALPATTASVVLQAPAGFLTAAGAANLVAQSAWLATTEANATAGTVAQAALEAAQQVKATTVGSPATVQAAQGVANAAMAKSASTTASDPAVAASGAVAGSVQAALGLAASNAAVTSLAGAQTVTVAAWKALPNGDVAQTAATAAQTAGTDAVSHAAALAVAEQATGTGQQAAVNLSSTLVPTVAGALPSLTVYASNPGEWANGSLGVTLDTNGITPSAVAAMGLVPAAGALPFEPGDFFNLTINYQAPDGSQMNERWTGLSLRPDAVSSRLDRVLANNSNLLAYPQPGQAYPPAPSPLPVSGAQGVAGIASNGSAAPELQGTASPPLTIEDYLGNQSTHTGLYALDQVDQFDILSIPPDGMIETTPPAIPPTDSNTDLWRMELYQTAAQYCMAHRAILVIDPPTSWANQVQAGNTSNIAITDLGTYGPEGEYAAVYFPYLVEGNPLMNGQLGYFAPSGAIAGVMARTDAARGVWKAPAGITDGALSGTMGLELKLSDTDNGLLNPQGINCLRTFPVYGNVVWGARTLKGADVLNDDYKYVPVRRLALYIEDSLLRGMQWAVFEPNAEPLWASIRLSVGSFMNTLYRQGAFAGTTAKDAYYVSCDATTTTQDDINQGIVNVLIGFAPLKPAEFVVITIQQMAGQTPT